MTATPILTERTLTELDHVRLKRLVQRHRHGGAAPAAMDAIDEMLDEAHLVPSTAVDPDVVTMNSQLELQDPATGMLGRVTVCYPPDANADEGRVSALSPIGWSLLGLRVGDTARWSTPTGEPRSARIVALLYQPEARGEFTT